MAESLEAVRHTGFADLALPRKREILDFLDRRGAGAAPFDPSYGDTLRALLPRRLGALMKRRRRN
jgi:hypothetical protein